MKGNCTYFEFSKIFWDFVGQMIVLARYYEKTEKLFGVVILLYVNSLLYWNHEIFTGNFLGQITEKARTGLFSGAIL